MWHRFLGEGGPPFWRRGDIKFIILELLKEGPKHGYEIMKEMEARFGGFYSPSPGSIYPTLQMLEDQGFLTSRPEDGRRVYEMTGAGQAFLDENKEAVGRARRRFEGPFPHIFRREVREVAREIRDLVRTLVHEARRGERRSPEKLRKVHDIISRARKEVEDVLSE